MMENENKLFQKKQNDLKQRETPMTKGDFDNLYKELEEWTYNEKLQIQENKSLTKEEEKQNLKQLLKKEIKLLQKIDEFKLKANSENKKIRITRFFKKLSRPKKWKRSDGRFTLVTTPESMQAAELHYLYKSLDQKPDDIESRLEILLKIRFITRSRNTQLTQEIDELINREADILNRGRSEASLEGLRKRLSVLFLEFIESPECYAQNKENSEAPNNVHV
jgi:hypothetical protein